MLCLGGTIIMHLIAGFFDAIADRWDELCYHDPEKLNYILDRTNLRKGLRILDVGCGTGILEKYLLLHSPSQIVAVDLSPKMIEQAQSKYAVKTIDFRCMDVMDLKEETFDYIIAYSVFPHFEEPQKVIHHLAGLLSPGGELVICHSESRERINGHHNKQANRISFGLPPSKELAALMEPYFTVKVTEDTDRLYLISGMRNT